MEDWQINSSSSVNLDVNSVATNLTCHDSGLFLLSCSLLRLF